MKVELKGLQVCGHCAHWTTGQINFVPFTGRCAVAGVMKDHDFSCESWEFSLMTAPYTGEQIKKIRRVVEDTLRKGGIAAVVNTAVRLGVVVDL